MGVIYIEMTTRYSLWAPKTDSIVTYYGASKSKVFRGASAFMATCAHITFRMDHPQ
jgi:hypothetical protein